MSSRIVVSLIRGVPTGLEEAYEQRWIQLQVATQALGANAWRFVSSSDSHRHIEFLEFAADSDPRVDAAVRGALDRLECEVGAAISEEWIEK